MDNYFDIAARNWDMKEQNIIRARAVAMEIKSIIPDKSNITALEFGAGTGLLSFALKDSFSDIILMDNSVEMMKVTTQKIQDASLNHLHAMHFDLEKNNFDKKFDVIFSMMALHHIVDYKYIISKLTSLLQPKGLLAIADVYTENGTFHDKDFVGHFGFDPNHLAEVLAENGLTEIKHKQCFVMEKMTETGIAQFPIFLISGTKK